MILTRWRIAAFILSALLVTSCVEDKDFGKANVLRPENANQNIEENVAPNSNANIAEDDELKLSQFVDFEYETEADTVWREEDISDDEEGGKRLIAVYRLAKEVGEKLKEDLSKGGERFDAQVDPETWFPPELIATSSTTGDTTLKGKGYPAGSLAKSPYKTGTIVHIDETNYFVLTLQTK